MFLAKTIKPFYVFLIFKGFMFLFCHVLVEKIVYHIITSQYNYKQAYDKDKADKIDNWLHYL